jgi:hypothetical protein
MRRLAALVVLGIVGLALAGSGSARPADDDVSTVVFLASNVTARETTGLSFRIRAEVEGTSGVPRQITLRIGLPAGLRWGTDGPDPTEGCTGDLTATCVQMMQLDGAGTARAGWEWDVVASQVGTYDITATASAAEPDPNVTNNTNTLRFEVKAAGGGGGGSGGGSTATTAGAAKLSPAKPKAGSAVVASVRVMRGGAPVRPSGVACKASVGGAKVTGKARAASGVASCRFGTPKSAKGKRLAGSVAFRAGGRSFTKRFATTLG